MKMLVNLDVDDLEKAVRFYSGAFGLTQGRRFGASGVEMLGGSSPIYLLVKAPGTVASDAATTQRRSYDRHWTPVHLDFVVEGEDISNAVQRAIAAGATLEKAREHQQLGQAGADGRSVRAWLLFCAVPRAGVRRDLGLLKASNKLPIKPPAGHVEPAR